METVEAMIEMLLVETTTLGVRYYEAKRRVLERSIEEVETRYGPVRIKVARDGERTLHFQPEYDDCARLAVETETSRCLKCRRQRSRRIRNQRLKPV